MFFGHLYQQPLRALQLTCAVTSVFAVGCVLTPQARQNQDMSLNVPCRMSDFKVYLSIVTGDQ